MQVEFVGEFGADTEGLKREFFTWFSHVFAKRFLTSTGTFIHNSVAMQVYAFLTSHNYFPTLIHAIIGIL
jgi:hypothetical protein